MMNTIPNLSNCTDFHGREEEIASLKSSFHGVQSGFPILLTISGETGTGKSLLVSEFFQQHVEGEAFICGGTCSKHSITREFSSIKDAMQNLCSDLLLDHESKEELVDNIQRELGNNAWALSALVPEFSKLISFPTSSRKSAESIADESLKKLFRAFVRLVTGLKPLVLFCDNSQQIDASSLNALRWLVTDPVLQRVMLILAHRDDEGCPDSDLDLLKKECRNHAHIHLSNWTLPELNGLVASVLRCEPTGTKSLSSVVHEKTDGNPFFVLQYLQELERRKMLMYSIPQSRWKWIDVDRIRSSTDVASNVVHLVANKIRGLPDDVLTCVKVASCISSTVSVSLLSSVLKGLGVLSNKKAVYGHLSRAESEGLILKVQEVRSTDVRFRFSHDLIQQAAYLLVPPGFERDLLHFKIGQKLFEQMWKSEDCDSDKDRTIYIAADQIHRGRTCITSENDYISMATLNLEAGRKAAKIAAFDHAVEYLNHGMVAMKKVRSPWQNHGRLFLSLHQCLAEALLCSGSLRESEAVAEIASEHARTTTDKVSATLSRVRVLSAQKKHREATRALISELRALGEFPRLRTQRGQATLRTLKARLSKVTKDDVLVLPTCQSEKTIAAMWLLQMLVAQATYDGNEGIQLLAMTLNAMLTLKHGLHKASIVSFAHVGALVCNQLGDAKEGNRIGSLSLALMRRLGEYDATTSLFVHMYVSPWKVPLTDTIDPLFTAYKKGMRHGEMESAFLAFNCYLVHSFLSGLSIDPLLDDAKSHVANVEEHGIGSVLAPAKVILHALLNLAEKKSKGSLVLCDEEDMNERDLLTSSNNAMGLFNYYIWKMQIAYYYEDFDLADKMREEAWKRRKAMSSFFDTVTMLYFNTLVPLAKAATTGSAHYKRRARVAVSALRKAISKEHKGINLIHKLNLLSAEFFALNEKRKSAEIRYGYSRAITMANRAGFRQDAALGNLKAGLYCIRHDRSWARHYLTRAFNLFREWGAHGVSTYLRTKYSGFVDDATSSTVSTDCKARRRYSNERKPVPATGAPNTHFLDDIPSDYL